MPHSPNRATGGVPAPAPASDKPSPINLIGQKSIRVYQKRHPNGPGRIWSLGLTYCSTIRTTAGISLYAVRLHNYSDPMGNSTTAGFVGIEGQFNKRLSCSTYQNSGASDAVFTPVLSALLHSCPIMDDERISSWSGTLRHRSRDLVAYGSCQ